MRISNAFFVVLLCLLLQILQGDAFLLCGAKSLPGTCSVSPFTEESDLFSWKESSSGAFAVSLPEAHRHYRPGQRGLRLRAAAHAGAKVIPG